MLNSRDIVMIAHPICGNNLILAIVVGEYNATSGRDGIEDQYFVKFIFGMQLHIGIQITHAAFVENDLVLLTPCKYGYGQETQF